MATFDLVIRGGTVVDGNGAPCFEADVGIQGTGIAAIGPGLTRGREEIDAKGLLVTPGFVDVHTHYDGQAVWDSRLQPSSWHGVTTAVMGNCGVGFAPVRPADRDLLVELMEGVEDIPGSVLNEGLDWRWESFGEYLDTLDKRPRDMDICAQLPHAALRVYVMGERATRLEEASAEDRARMRQLAADAVRAGAIGFSTSRTLNHRTVKGDPTPSLRASEAELMAIALGLKDAQGGVIEYISDWNTPDTATEFAMIRRLVQDSGRPLSFSLGQRHSADDDFRQKLDLTAQAVADGLQIRAQVAPRPIGVLLGLEGSRHPFLTAPSYRAIADKPLAERVAVMRQPEFRERVLAEMQSLAKDRADPFLRRATAFRQIFPLGDPPDYEPPQERSIASLAERQGCSPMQLAYDLLLEDDGHALLLVPFANYADGNLDACGEMLGHPQSLLGLGDGGAHVGVISDASFTTYLRLGDRDLAAALLRIGPRSAQQRAGGVLALPLAIALAASLAVCFQPAAVCLPLPIGVVAAPLPGFFPRGFPVALDVPAAGLALRLGVAAGEPVCPVPSEVRAVGHERTWTRRHARLLLADPRNFPVGRDSRTAARWTCTWTGRPSAGRTPWGRGWRTWPSSRPDPSKRGRVG